MREIKFRAWHPVSEEMIYFDTKQMRRDHIIASHFFDLMNNEHEEGKDLFMQFTGLTDKNGVEIYEGDLVVGNYGGGPQVVKFKIAKVSNTYGHGDNGTDHTSGFCISGYYGSEFKVVGNTHQNPELL